MLRVLVLDVGELEQRLPALAVDGLGEREFVGRVERINPAASVFATPGRPSSEMCSWSMRPMSSESIISRWPTTTLETSLNIRSTN